MSATSTLRTQSRASASRRCCSVAVLLRRGNPDRRKAISASRCSSNAASRRSCFCLRGSAFRIVAGCRTRCVTPRSSSSCRNHPIEPVASSPTTDWCRQAGVEFPTAPAWCFKVFPTISPAWRSNIAIVCWAACRSHPIIFISASFDPSAVSMDTHSLLRRSRGRRRYDISLKMDRCRTARPLTGLVRSSVASSSTRCDTRHSGTFQRMAVARWTATDTRGRRSEAAAVRTVLRWRR
jgi:hypothetical protein